MLELSFRDLIQPACSCLPAGEALLRAGLLYLPDLDIYLAKVRGEAEGGASLPALRLLYADNVRVCSALHPHVEDMITSLHTAAWSMPHQLAASPHRPLNLAGAGGAALPAGRRVCAAPGAAVLRGGAGETPVRI